MKIIQLFRLICVLLCLILSSCGGSSDSQTEYRATLFTEANRPAHLFFVFDEFSSIISGTAELFEPDNTVRSGIVEGTKNHDTIELTITFPETQEVLEFNGEAQGEKFIGNFTLQNSIERSLTNSTGVMVAEVSSTPGSSDKVFMRSHIGSTGSVTDPLAAAGTSPDIIPVGTQPDEGIFSLSYDTDAGQDLSSGRANYIYPRVKNGSGSLSGETRTQLYWARGSLTLVPDIWRNNQLTLTSGSTDANFSNILPGASAISPEPFVFTPPPLSSSEVYSLISTVSSPESPQNLPSTDDVCPLLNLSRWLASSGTVVRTVKHVSVNDSQATLTIDLRNPCFDSENFYLGISTRNVPAGNEVSLETDFPLAPLSISPLRITNGSSFLASASNTVPSQAQFQATLTYKRLAAAPSPGAEISIVLHIPLSSQSEPIYSPSSGPGSTGYYPQSVPPVAMTLIGEATLKFY